jgi:chemotaxis protein histidine kinase CheA
MPRRQKAAADLVETADDVEDMDLDGAEFIEPQVDLRSKAKERKPKPGERDPVAAAEAALKRMEKSFGAWILDEINTLDKAYHAAEHAGFEGEAMLTFYRSSHDIKGQAATLGFPFAGRVAASLCRLLDHVDGTALPVDLVRQHVQAIRAIVHEGAREEGNALARTLAERLAEVTEDYVETL